MSSQASAEMSSSQGRRPYGGMSLISHGINMINCYNQCKRFFDVFESVQFEVLIAYWMMAGYLGAHPSVEAAYTKGFDVLFDLLHKEKILKRSRNDPRMIRFAGSTSSSLSNPRCRHPGFCHERDDDWVRTGFIEVMHLKLFIVGKVVLSNDHHEMLSLDPKQELNKYFATFINPTSSHGSLKPLLENAKSPSVLLLRGFDELPLLLQTDCFPLDKLRSLTILEISSSTRLTTIPENTISQLIHLECLNLSNLPIEALPRNFFRGLGRLRWLVLRGCCELRTLELDFKGLMLTVLDLSHCTALQNLVCYDANSFLSLRVLDLSYTLSNPSKLFASSDRLSHLYLRGSKLEDLSPLKEPKYICVLDLSGCSSLTQLDEALLNKMSRLWKLDLSWTKVKHLPSLAKLTSLRVLSLRGLELDSLETLSSLPNSLVELDLMCLKISSSQKLELDFLQFLENLQILNLSQTSVAKLPDMSKLVSLKKLLLANCHHLTVMPDLQALTNLETLDHSLPNDPSSNNCARESETEGHQSYSLVPTSFMSACDTITEAQQPQERSPKPAEIHIVSLQDDESNDSQQPTQPSDFDHFDEDKLISSIKEKLNSAPPAATIADDLNYIKENMLNLKGSNNWKSCEELLLELKDAADNMSTTDSANLKMILQMIVKLKLLVPRTRTSNSEALQVTKREKKKKKAFVKRQNKENVVIKNTPEMEAELSKSYESLSNTHKDCLLCFSVFPCNEDRSLEIKKKILIYWWVGEGFIDPPLNEEDVDPRPTLNPNLEPHTNTKTVEEIGKQILKELANKGFVEPVMKKGRETGSCCIHPFVHAFVIERAKEVPFFDFGQEKGKLAPTFARSKRACLLKPPSDSSRSSSSSSCRLWANYIRSPSKLKSFETVKTLFNVNESMIDIRKEWFSKMKKLSVLYLGVWQSESTDPIEVSNEEFMEGLKKMRQLKLLSLQSLPTIMKLPDSVCYLSSLIILDLKECTYLEELPTGIGSLKSLTHLDISNCPLLYKLPKGIRLLSKLEVLRGFVITDVLQATTQDSQARNMSFLGRWWAKTKRSGLFCCQNDEECTLKDLLKLEQLRELSITVNISKFPEDEDLWVFKEMKRLCKLKIMWERSIKSEKTESAPTGHELLVGQNMEKLELWCFPYANAPYWLNPEGLKSLKKLYFVGGHLKELRGSAGGESNRWNVETVRLKYLSKLETEWPELESMFPKLMYLEKVPYDQHECFPFDKTGVWRSGS